MTEDRMPERIWARPDTHEGVWATEPDGYADETEYVRRDQLDKALDMIERALESSDYECDRRVYRTFLSTHRPLTDRGNQ